MAKPSILFINRTYPPMRSTSGRLLKELAQEFERSGWQVTILTSSKKTVYDRDGTIKLIKISAPGNHANPFLSIWIWMKLLFAAWREPKTDLLITMSDPPMLAIAGQILARLKKTRHFHWCQELYPDLLTARYPYLPSFMMKALKSCARRAMNGCEKVIVPGRCMARHLLRGGVERQKISVISNWADLQLTRAVEKDEAAVFLKPESRPDGTRPAFPYDDTPKFRIMHTGHIKRFHALDTILEAARLLDADHPEIEFVFIGTGAPFDRLAEERARLGLHNIKLMPFQPAEQDELVMKMGDLHLISLQDGAAGLVMPRRLHTAFAVERPCIFIGPESCDAAALIREYGAGSCVSAKDAKGLVSMILHYRLNGGEWFAAQQGAQAAARALSPEKSLRLWLTMTSNPVTTT